MSEVKIKARVVRGAKVFTMDKQSQQETMVMLIAKVIKPEKWASDEKNKVFFLTQELEYADPRKTRLQYAPARFAAIATSEPGDIIVLKTDEFTDHILGREFLSGKVFSFYNKTTELGDWEIDCD